MLKSPILNDLEARGLLNQFTAGLDDHLMEGSRTLYCGFDPSADSLHIGSLVPLLTLRRFQLAGHRPIVLVGGSTGMIGDPSFKAEERALKTPETVRAFASSLKTQMEKFVSFDDKPGQPAAMMANNYDWTGDVPVLDFLRDVGKYFSVNAMIARDAVKTRLEREDVGISFTEFSYVLLQAFDFWYMYAHDAYHHCSVQLGGSDQFGNITAGTELVRKKAGGQAYGLTMPLVTKADGTKFGKSESGAVWLDATKTSPYMFYQFWLNTADADVERYLLYFSFRTVDEIKAIAADHAKAPEKRMGQQILAEDVTKLVHSETALAAAQRISEALFGGDLSALTESDLAQLALDGMPTLKATEGMTLLSALTESALAKSNREARDFLTGNAVQLNGATVTDGAMVLSPTLALFGKYLILRRGKKNYVLITL
jgi:tyrosyl-tRNA synthetase